MKKIDIYKKDALSYIYFISAMAQQKMYGGLANKSDLIGGIFDRWINIISEGVIFNKYFLPKINENYKAISDFYRYKPNKEGIAPDLIGVDIGSKQIPFVKYGETGWKQYKNAPQIEVKTFKKDQYLVSLRNQNYDGKYLVMLEMNLEPDYLSHFIQSDIYSEENLKSLKMNDDIFMEQGFDGLLDQTKRIMQSDIIGTLKLIKVVTASSFMEISDSCGAGISPHYIKDIKQTRTTKNFVLDKSKHILLSKYVGFSNKLYRFNKKWYKMFGLKKILTLGINVLNIKFVYVIKNSKSSLTIFAEKDAEVNGVKLNKGNTYIIKFGLLDRQGSKDSEYFMHKSIVEVNDDFESDIITKIERHIDSEI